jgi:hypothetical protein
VSLVPGWQTLFAQHPFGQPVELQTHRPPTHASPAPHGALPPHVQVPPVQLSVATGSHVEQNPPATPHVAVDAGLHVVPLQHPFGQLVALQTH